METSNYTVITVDDEPIVHQMLARIIGDSDLSVEVVGNAFSGKDALKIASEMRPNICLLDIHMDDMDGLELASHLEEIPNYKPRIIYLTAYDRFEYAQKAVRLGAADYILKPINRNELISTLQRTINDLQAERLDKIDREQMKKRVENVMPSLIPEALAAGENRNVAIAKVVRKYVDENYSQRLTLAKVAELVNLSEGYLGSIFKAASGMTFRSYLRLVRVARAKELLQNQSLNLSQIAEAVGYDDINYFSQVFLEETGIRPSEYRGGGRRWAK